MPPTRLANFGYRRFDPNGSLSRQAGASLTSPRVAWLSGPWPGYEPSMSPAIATPGAASLVLNMIEHEGVLSQQNGYERVGSATLPLGGTSPPDVGSEEPLVGIFQGRTNSTQAVRRYAVTSDVGANGHFYELVSGAWTNRAAGTTVFTGDASDPASTLVDAAHFQVGDYNVFCGGQGNPIFRFPGASVAAEYEVLGNLGSVTSIGANSVCSAEERIHAFGTIENGTFYPARWRWTSKGASGQFDPLSTGASFADLNEFGSEGLCVRPIGNKVALYLTNGGMLAARTGISTDPFRKDYAWTDRGLLSTHSIVDLGFGIHFGLFTDGWFMLRYDGQWEERGVRDQYHKWMHEFYGTLDWANRKRVICEYDPGERVVYIAFPQAGSGVDYPTAVWLYDIQTDTVWPADWPELPNCFGQYIEEVAAGPAWSAMTTTWGGTAGSWGSLETQIGRSRVQHGTSDGYVYTHRPDLVTRDSVLPTYLYRSHFITGPRPDQHKKLDGLYIDYTRVQGNNNSDPTPISVTLENENGTQRTGSISQTEGPTLSVQTDFVTGAVDGTAVRFTISGQAPVKINRIGLQMYEESDSVRKEGAD